MNTVTLSNEYQLVFPEEIREATCLKAGTSFEVIPYNNRIELIPIKPIKNLKGIFKGIDTNIIRDNDRMVNSKSREIYESTNAERKRN